MADDRRLFAGAITCSKFERDLDGGCMHYQGEGLCALPDGLVCTEWKKASAELVRPAPARAKLPVQRNLFGEPVEAPKLVAPAKLSAPAQRVQVPLLAEPSPAKEPFGLMPEDVAAFEAAGQEYRLDCGGSDIWLVPRVTGADRQEFTARELATVIHVATVFPGARLKEVRRIAHVAPRAAEVSP